MPIEEIQRVYVDSGPFGYLFLVSLTSLTITYFCGQQNNRGRQMGFSRSSHGRGLRQVAPATLLYHGKILGYFFSMFFSCFLSWVEFNRTCSCSHCNPFHPKQWDKGPFRLIFVCKQIYLQYNLSARAPKKKPQHT